MKTLHVLGLCAVAAFVTASSAHADPLPGQVLKFQQNPMIATTMPSDSAEPPVYYGHDEISTAYGSHVEGVYQGTFMADDFSDKVSTPVVHVRWWGSYPGAQPTSVPAAGGVTRFLISFEKDVPDPGDPHNHEDGFSRPGDPILSQVVTLGDLTPGSGTFTEKLVLDSNPNEPVYEYNAELACPFPEQAEEVYWLKIVALVDPQQDGEILWGWHNRDYTVMDALAAGPPVPSPGEHDDQPIIDPFYPTPVWHFQDDAVSGGVYVQVLQTCLVNVLQSESTPQYYIDGVDGPGPDGVHNGIGQFSKDLAFELYTIPEPAALSLLALGSLLLRRRGS
ncbi:MAG: hypothetical protein IT442_07095 [Phycisphaeraceae bacterium]|nr:hypothetical protein [Phycisphaeraceae bacterium]